MGIAERREREKQQRRNDILDAAEKIFFSKGMENATMDDVADEVELSKGTLYLYFKNKEELYLGITVRGIEILTGMISKATGIQASGFEKTIEIGRAFHKFAITYPNYFNALSYYELKEHNYCDECPMARECSDYGQGALDLLISTIREGIGDGSIRPELDPGKAALLLWGMTSGMIQLITMKGKHLQENHNFDIDGLMDYMFDFIRCSLENQEGGKA